MQTRSGIKLTEIPIDIVPNKILQIMLSHEGFKTSTIFGKEGLGDPEEYEKLVLGDEAGTRTFEFFNKGLSHMMYGTEEDRPIFQVFAHFHGYHSGRHA